MKLVFSVILVFLVFFGNAQETYKTNTIEIIDKNCPLILQVDVTFVYFPTGFVLTSSDTRVYSYLIPGIEFCQPTNITFYDTGVQLNDTINFKKDIPIVIYRSTLSKVELAQQVDSTGITLMKKNTTGIHFYKK